MDIVAATRVYGRRPVFPEKNYDRTYHGIEPPLSQQYTRRGQNRRHWQFDRVTWDQNAKHLEQITGAAYPKSGPLPKGTLLMLDEFGLHAPTFFKTKAQTKDVPSYTMNGDPIMEITDDGFSRQVIIAVKVTSGWQAKFLDGPVFQVDPLGDEIVAASVMYKSPDLAIVQYQRRQVKMAEKYGDARMVPAKASWHPKTPGWVQVEGEKLRDELLSSAV